MDLNPDKQQCEPSIEDDRDSAHSMHKNLEEIGEGVQETENASSNKPLVYLDSSNVCFAEAIPDILDIYARQNIYREDKNTTLESAYTVQLHRTEKENAENIQNCSRTVGTPASDTENGKTDKNDEEKSIFEIHTQCISVQTNEDEYGTQTENISVQTDYGMSSKVHIAIQTDYEKQDVETITDTNIVQILEELVNQRERLKLNYQDVLDKQTQAERKLQVQVKQLKQRQEEEIQKQQEMLKSIQEVTTRKEETRKRMDKERKEHLQKEQDLRADLEKLQNKTQKLLLEQNELDCKIAMVLSEQTKEKEQWDAEFESVKKLENEMSQNVLEETERALQAEVLSLESRRDFLLASLEEAENEAEVTLFRIRAAPRTLELIKLEQRWDGRLDGILKMKANLRDQFSIQIQQVKNGAMLSSLPSILPPNLAPPPSDTSLLLHKIAITPLQVSNLAMPMPLSSRETFHVTPQMSSSIPSQTNPHLPVTTSFGNHIPLVPRVPCAPQLSGPSEVPAPPVVEKIGKIMEKLQTRFPRCSQAHLTGILQQIKNSRGTLSGLTMEELYKHVAERLIETPDPGTRVALPPGNSRPSYHGLPGVPPFIPQSQNTYTVRPSPTSAPCKLCLICQKFVYNADLQPMSCSHAMHRECIKFWAQTNKNDSCPFCPSQR